MLKKKDYEWKLKKLKKKKKEKGTKGNFVCY